MRSRLRIRALWGLVALAGLATAWLLWGNVDEPTSEPSRPSPELCRALHRSTAPLSQTLAPYADQAAVGTGAYVLERGNDALLARAWLSSAAEKSLDVQYFIFATDNVGLIASDFLLRAAERGIKVRILVDDLLVDADADQLLAFDAHPNLEVRIYNPNANLGKTLGDKVSALARDFRGVNQRMHNKTFIVDGRAVITGGRNVADEYFDYDERYSFRDRDVLLLGGIVADVQRSFEDFWNDALSQPLSKVVLRSARAPRPEQVWRELHDYACDPNNFWPEVHADILALPKALEVLETRRTLRWVPGARFVSDRPGKNDGTQGLAGGGITTDALFNLVQSAEREVVIQSPYLVANEEIQALFAQTVARGVTVRILTNSLASTDNLNAFSGYARNRAALLEAGLEVFEFRPDAKVRGERMAAHLERRKGHAPIFGLHAKTMVIDARTVVIGTFNLDPRSVNLNTECITILPSEALARDVLHHIREEMQPENAWPTTKDQNPDANAGAWRRATLLLHRLVPTAIL